MIPIEQLYEEMYPRIYKWFMSHLTGFAEPFVAEDFTQDTFLRAIKTYDSFDGNDAAVQAWLFTIARNILYDSFRRTSAPKHSGHGAVQSLDEIPEDFHPSSLDYAVEGTHARLDVVHAAATLPASQFETLNLRVEQDLTVEEVAIAQGVTENAVKKKIARARAHLRNLLEDDYNTQGRFGGRVSLPPFPKPQAA